MPLYTSRSCSTVDASLWPGTDKVLAQLLHNRGVSPDERAYAWPERMRPSLLKNMDKIVERLLLAHAAQKRIVVVGDYDVDGATSISIMLTGLHMLGYRNIFYVVPHRFTHGYGLTPVLIPVIIQYQADMVITVDNGMHSVAAVDDLTALSVEVIITDHHLPGAEQPRALILNPQQAGCSFEDKEIAGCTVAWLLMLALRQALKVQVSFNVLTIYAALGTVADCVPLTYVNRVLVQKGLELIRQGLAPPGLKALMRLSSVREDRIVSGDIAFKIAPRLNASGRLEDMSLGVQCLLADSEETALPLAEHLHALNAQRQDIQEDMQRQALEQLVDSDAAHVLFNASWHQGVVGLIASRLREVSKKPSIVFAWDAVKNCFKGSGRSVQGLHLKEILDAISVRQPGLMLNFGGHAMAVGLSVPEGQLDNFRSVFVELCTEALVDCSVEADIVYDGLLPEQYLTSECLDALYQQHPFGMGFEEPTYVTKIMDVKVSLSKNGHTQVQGYSPFLKRLLSGWIFKSSPVQAPERSGSTWVFFQYLGGDAQCLRIKILACLTEEEALRLGFSLEQGAV